MLFSVQPTWCGLSIRRKIPQVLFAGNWTDVTFEDVSLLIQEASSVHQPQFPLNSTSVKIHDLDQRIFTDQDNNIHACEFTLAFLLLHFRFTLHRTMENSVNTNIQISAAVYCNYNFFLHISCFLLLVNNDFGTFLTKTLLNLTIYRCLI